MTAFDWPWIWVHTPTGRNTHILAMDATGPGLPQHTLCGMARAEHPALADGKDGQLCARCRRALDRQLRLIIDGFDPLLQQGHTRPGDYALLSPIEPWAIVARKQANRLEALEVALLEIAPDVMERAWGGARPAP